MKKFYRENRVFSILMIVSIICIALILGFMFIYFFNGQGNNKYGSRLEAIKNIKISDAKIKEYETSIAKENGIENSDISIKGKIVYIILYLKKDFASSDGVNASLKAISLFDEEVQTNFDFNFTIEKKEKDEAEIFPIVGYKNAESANIVWSKY